MIDRWINIPRKNRNALARYFHVVGQQAIYMVMEGKLDYDTAMELLLMLRRLKLDDKGDIAAKRTVEAWFLRHKLNKNVTFQELYG